MTLHWTKQDAPRWDADKRGMFGPDELAATGLQAPVDDAPLADEWWQVSDDGGAVLGYGWLDSEWGDAQITFVVAPGARGRGVGAYVVENLERAAAARGLNYIYNVVPSSHPDPSWMRQWLALRGFRASARGDLRRQVRVAEPPSAAD